MEIILETKPIRLVAQQPFHNDVDLVIYDFGGPDGSLRKRGKITVDYSSYEVKQLKMQGVETLEAALDHYKELIFNTCRRYLLVAPDLIPDEEGKGGWEEILTIIKEHIAPHYED